MGFRRPSRSGWFAAAMLPVTVASPENIVFGHAGVDDRE